MWYSRSLFLPTFLPHFHHKVCCTAGAYVCKQFSSFSPKSMQYIRSLSLEKILPYFHGKSSGTAKAYYCTYICLTFTKKYAVLMHSNFAMCLPNSLQFSLSLFLGGFQKFQSKYTSFLFSVNIPSSSASRFHQVS